MKPTTAAILAGGLGSRLQSAVADRQKVVAEVAGRPFLFHLLDNLESQGIRRVILCTGHLAETVRDAVAEHPGDIEIRWSEETEPLGTGGALGLARLLLGDDERIFALNGDSLCDVDLGALYAWHCKMAATGTLTLTWKEDASRYGGVDLEDGRVAAFVEKGRSGAGWVNAGIYCLEPEVLASLPSDRRVSLEHDVFPHQERLFGHCGGGRHLDIGLPETYAAASSWLARQPDPDRDRVVFLESDVLEHPGSARALRRFKELGLKIAVNGAPTDGLDLGSGFLIGDTSSAIRRGRALGATTLMVRTGSGEVERHEAGELADYIVEDLWCAALTVERLIS